MSGKKGMLFTPALHPRGFQGKYTNKPYGLTTKSKKLVVAAVPSKTRVAILKAAKSTAKVKGIKGAKPINKPKSVNAVVGKRKYKVKKVT